MFLCCWLALTALIPLTLSTNPGVKVKLTAKGLEYGKVCGPLYSNSWKSRISPESHHHIPLPFCDRQTTGDGFHPEETQNHQSPRYVRAQESVSHWQGQVQLDKVRRQIIRHSGNILWVTGILHKRHVVSLSIRIVDVGLPTSALDLVPGTGVRLSIAKAFISLHGNWRVKYLRIM